MKPLDKLFGKQAASAKLHDPVIPVPIPSLVALLVNLERQKGEALTEDEVLEARDNATVVAIPVSMRNEIAANRGYDDIDPSNVWKEWVEIRPRLLAEGD